MNQLLINIANRIVCKAIKVNTDEYNIQVAYKFISGAGAIIVTIFNKAFDNKSYSFYDDSTYSKKHYLELYKTILKKIRKREL